MRVHEWPIERRADIHYKHWRKYLIMTSNSSDNVTYRHVRHTADVKGVVFPLRGSHTHQTDDIRSVLWSVPRGWMDWRMYTERYVNITPFTTQHELLKIHALSSRNISNIFLTERIPLSSLLSLSFQTRVQTSDLRQQIKQFKIYIRISLFLFYLFIYFTKLLTATISIKFSLPSLVNLPFTITLYSGEEV